MTLTSRFFEDRQMIYRLRTLDAIDDLNGCKTDDGAYVGGGPRAVNMVALQKSAGLTYGIFCPVVGALVKEGLAVIETGPHNLKAVFLTPLGSDAVAKWRSIKGLLATDGEDEER